MALVDDLRRLASVGTADYSLDGTNYWTDAQLQERLDERRALTVEQDLLWIQQTGAGTAYYQMASVSTPGDIEAGTAGGTIIDSEGGTITGWTADRDGLISFAADTGGSAYSFTGYSYDLYAAAADVLENYAAAVADQFNFSTDDQSFDRSQKHEQLLRSAERYRARSSFGLGGDTQMIRSDVVPSAER